MTTLPWVVATARDATDGADPALRTFTGTSGLRMAGWMTAKRWAFLSAECYLLEDGEWTEHRVAEVFLGYIGKANTPVAVFRDAHGVDFCPDAPEVPPTALADLKLVDFRQELTLYRH